MTEKATFAAGCFWGIEAAFRRINGVINTQVGYTGGDYENPSYEDVCSGRTGHAESVEVEFDPNLVSYGNLLNAFWNIHEPTSKNRQGLDIGSQYRSAIFYHTEEQREKAIRSKNDMNASDKFGREIVTEIEPAGKFYRAEEYHQCYYDKKGVIH
ncbi:MAG: peptide-methionine (S)-S-oxide reductase MsrA [candidate division Zixibacteria bacterium]|nr:peptide-methionine (S)-S-oxide reductase MsrA [candidate division Zixibacteria bacterium]